MPLKIFRRAGSKSKTYYMRGTVAGHSVYKSTGLVARADAAAFANRYERQILERHALGEKATLTFAEAALDYMETGGEARFLPPILEHFGPDTRVADLDNRQLAEAAQAIYPAGSNATINRQLIKPVSAIVNRAAENGRADPKKFHTLPVPRSRRDWLDPAEFDAILAAAAPHAKPILMFLIGSGCRATEALSLEARNWHPATGEAWIAEAKNGWPRMVQLPQRARDHLVDYGLPVRGRVFLTPKGDPYVIRKNGGGQIKTALDNAVDLAGIGRRVTPHLLRHTWAVWFHAQTRSYGDLLDLGGWRSSAAEIYRKAAPSDLARRLEAHGWDFRVRGADLPDLAKPALRVVE
jgi:integrase